MSNLSESAQECMKRLPKLTALLREKGLMTKINQIMQQNPNLTYDEIINTILDFDDVSIECIADLLANGDVDGETILSNYGQKCTSKIEEVSNFYKQKKLTYRIRVDGVDENNKEQIDQAVNDLSFKLKDSGATVSFDETFPTN